MFPAVDTYVQALEKFVSLWMEISGLGKASLALGDRWSNVMRPEMQSSSSFRRQRASENSHVVGDGIGHGIGSRVRRCC